MKKVVFKNDSSVLCLINNPKLIVYFLEAFPGRGSWTAANTIVFSDMSRETLAMYLSLEGFKFNDYRLIG